MTTYEVAMRGGRFVVVDAIGRRVSRRRNARREWAEEEAAKYAGQSPEDVRCNTGYWGSNTDPRD